MNYTWKVLRCRRVASTGMIYAVTFKLYGRKGNLKTSLQDYIKFKKSDNPIPFENLTEDDIITWIKNKIGSTKEQKYYDILEQEIERQEAALVTVGNPWDSQVDS
tara:strand:+ start:219 stop:533 length:315 start_codon:yes stop_codon:yes gene_type:complete